MSPKLVVLGASGFLGRSFLRVAAERSVEVLAVSRDPEASARALPGFRWTALEGWERELAGATAVLHSLALTDHGACERDPELAMRVNRDTAAEAAARCRDLGIPFHYVCTDGLFPNGRPAPHYWTLSDPPEPVSAYGRSKLAAERALAELGWGHSLRMSFVGASQGTGRGLIAFLARCLQSPERRVTGFADNLFTPAPALGAAARMLDLCLEARPGFSVRQWGSFPALSKHDYLEQVARAAGFELRMEALYRAQMPGAESVQLDQSLACEDPWTREQLIAAGAQALREELG